MMSGVWFVKGRVLIALVSAVMGREVGEGGRGADRADESRCVSPMKRKKAEKFLKKVLCTYN